MQLDKQDQDRIDAMTVEELLNAFVANVRLVATVCEDVLGDKPVPDPREMVKQLQDITPLTWVEMFRDQATRDSLWQQMPLMKAMAAVNHENMYIVLRMMKVPTT